MPGVNRSRPSVQSELKSQISFPLNDEVWTRENVASFLKLDDPNQVYELTRKRNRHPLPVHRVGKQMRFSKAEVIAWFYEKAA